MATLDYDKAIGRLPEFVELAYLWHGGQWSAFYSYASTGGYVWSTDHLSDLVSELDKCIGYAEAEDISDWCELMEFRAALEELA